MNEDSVEVLRVGLLRVPILELLIVRMEFHSAPDTLSDEEVDKDIDLFVRRHPVGDILVDILEMLYDIGNGLAVTSEG